MTATLRAAAHATGGRIDLRVAVERPSGGAGVPALRLVRRRLAPPATPLDGLPVADVPELFISPTQPWQRLERMRFLTTGTPTDPVTEAELTLWYASPAPTQPGQARVALFDPATQAVVEDVVTEVTRVERPSAPAPGWTLREAFELFAAPGGGLEVPAGVFEVFTGNDDPTIADQVVWTPAGGTARAGEFDAQRRWKTDRTEASILTFETRVTDTEPGLVWLSAAIAQNPDAGTESWTIDVRDRDLEPLVDYYYSLFDLAESEPLAARAVALATQDYDSPRRLFLRLPGAYQRADEPDPSTPTGASGPLRRFLAPVGHTLDLARSLAEGIRNRHDVHTARADLLPPLARTIGWTPDLTAPTEAQRRDLAFAPEIFGSVGTGPNVRALVNRVTEWPARIKEFVHNVFLTNAPETIRLWELWVRRYDGVTWTAPETATLTDGFDGRPAAVTDAGAVPWLFWHSQRSGRREIWMQRLGVDAEPRRAMEGAPDDTEAFGAVDEYPAAARDGTRIWMVWDADRSGQWDIWACPFDAVPGGEPVRLTDHLARDRHPAAVLDPGGRLWVFWDSDRRGPTDIWAAVLDAGAWSEPERITSAAFRHQMPAAALDGAGRLWLFWTEDTGSRRYVSGRVLDGGAWGPEERLTDGAQRDEMPAAAWWNNQLWLLWHSDLGGRWQIRGRVREAGVWGAPFKLVGDPTANKDPAALVDGAGNLRVFWRSQHRGQHYRSRTLDLDDQAMLDAMGTYVDRAHYTYDTGRGDDDWYARDTAGLYLTPDIVDAGAVTAAARRAAAFLEPFRPAPVRYVWPLDEIAHDEVIDVGGMGETWSDGV